MAEGPDTNSGDAIASRFYALFRGSDRSHGLYRAAERTPVRCKVEGSARTVRGPATIAAWKSHLYGEVGLGIVPVDGAGACRFGAIDVDEYQLDLPAFARRVAAARLPLICCRSKSGGAHAYLFLSQPTPAELVRRKLGEWAAALGFRSSEIFPKQDRLLGQDDGNWINLPYQGGDRSLRYALDPETGTSLEPEEFLDRAEAARVTIDALRGLRAEPSAASPVDAVLDGAPPCLRALARIGFHHGTRSNGLFNVAVFLRKKFPDDWQQRVAECNATMAHPPLSPSEISGITKSVARKDYFYRCNEAPIREACDKEECRQTEFGIGSRGDAVRGGQAGNRELRALLDIANGAEVFHTPDGAGYADVMIDGHRETHPTKGRAFRQWLALSYYRAAGRAPSAGALAQVREIAEGRAQFDGPEQETFLRVGRTADAIYLDLCDASWRAVEVTSAGWRVIDSSPVRFRRRDGALALPEPAPGGSIDELRPLLNVDDDGFALTVGWLLGALRGEGPYAVLAVSGEQGSAKSTFCKLVRNLIDPNAVPLRGLLRHDHDLHIAAYNGHVQCFDNVSKISDWLSDTLCRLATGGGFSTRELYADTDEVLFRGMRPILLNGIEDFIERPDLADRSIALLLPSIAEAERRTEADMMRAYEAARPRVLGALLDALSRGLRDLPITRLDAMPRMADFALWVAACEGALWEPGTFGAAYAENRGSGQADLVEADAVASAIMRLMNDPGHHEKGRAVPGRSEWCGTRAELLFELNMQVDDTAYRDPRWPRTPKAIGDRVRRMAAGLRRLGIEPIFPKRSHGTNRVILRRLPRVGDQGVLGIEAEGVSLQEMEAEWRDAGPLDSPTL